MEKKTIVFDFDGTLVKTLDAIVEIYNRVAPQFHCRTVADKDRELLRSKKPQSFLKDYGVTNFKLFFLLLRIRKELKKDLASLEPVEGIVETLKSLHNAGYRLGIMSSNSKDNIKSFLRDHGIEEIFDFIYSGTNIFGKDKVIFHLLKERGLGKDSVIYVGDETRDIEACKKVGISVVAVSWGFNIKEALEKEGPDKIAESPKELLNCLQEN